MISHLFPQIVDWLVLKDDKKNTLRIAGFVNNNLECFFAASTDLTTTLSSHYLEQQLTEEHSLARRFTLMSGLSNDGRGEVGPMICSCFQVGENLIKQAISSGQCHSVESLGQLLKCGTNCGSCIPELKTLLNAV
jgi:assimilatory nitrate reductase catalytic subunit